MNIDFSIVRANTSIYMTYPKLRHIAYSFKCVLRGTLRKYHLNGSTLLLHDRQVYTVSLNLNRWIGLALFQQPEHYNLCRYPTH